MSDSSKKHKDEAPATLRFGIYTCSTSRYAKLKSGEKADDLSGDIIESLLRSHGHSVSVRGTIPDDAALIREAATAMLNDHGIDVLIFCGGTGVAPSDVTIETVSPLFEKTLPGFGEIFRRISYDEIGSAAVMSRAVGGVARGKAVFCLPGSPDAVRLCMEKLVLPESGHIVKHARE